MFRLAVAGPARALGIALGSVGFILSSTHAQPAPQEVASAPAHDEVAPYDPEPPPRIEGCEAAMHERIRLSGTIYDPKRPDRSLAILGKRSEPGTAVYRRGARIGSMALVEVHPNAVMLETEGGSPCWLRISAAGALPPAPPEEKPKEKPKEKKKKRGRASVFSKEELEQKVKRVGEGQYRVERSILQRALERVPDLAKGTRTRVVQRNGAPIGVSLKKLPRDGLLSHLGLERGDVLKTVNGISFANVDGMLSARTQLTTASRLSLALLRGGKQITLEYHVH